ncbi:MAG: hypothetical protein WCO45_02030 [Pseudanabaena sp. ELA607]
MPDVLAFATLYFYRSQVGSACAGKIQMNKQLKGSKLEVNHMVRNSTFDSFFFIFLIGIGDDLAL